jgi:hypothetical protein
MQLTTEDFQRYLRIFLQWAAGALISYGFVKPDATWIAPAIGMAMTLGSFLWTLYGNRVQAKINEVAKLDVVTSVKVSSKAVAAAAPVNVTPTPTAQP